LILLADLLKALDGMRPDIYPRLNYFSVRELEVYDMITFFLKELLGFLLVFIGLLHTVDQGLIQVKYYRLSDRRVFGLR